MIAVIVTDTAFAAARIRYNGAVSTPDRRLDETAASLPRRVLRRDLAGAEALAARAGVTIPSRTAVVVGTNGKTSTATFLARILQAGGLRVGLTVSPHLRRWGERVLVDGYEVAVGELADRVEALRAVAAGLDVRFFDLLTFAAAEIFVEREVDVAVFEAGIGGRLDPTRLLHPQLVALTSVGLDHVELLGPDERSILVEKLGVAAPGSLVVAAPLGAGLEAEAERIAAAGGFGLAWPELGSGTFLERNSALASAVAARVRPGLAAVDLGEISGRMQRLRVDGVDVILDAAHNAQAWLTLAKELPPRFVAVVSVSADKEADALRTALGGAAAVIATCAWPGRSLGAHELADAVGGEAVDEPRAATRAGLERAQALAVPLVVFGSAYLLRHAFDEFGV
jgi:dihydrofolate synthase / folylpolyglutamate synthase